MAFTLDIYPHSQRAVMAFNQPFDLIAKKWKRNENVFRFCFNDFQNVIFFTDNVKLQI